jgi:hypothetical protein
MAFKCPKCQSTMFGSSFNDGIVTYHCHGNEQWHCDFKCNEKYFNDHFNDFPRYTMVVQITAQNTQKPSAAQIADDIDAYAASSGYLSVTVRYMMRMWSRQLRLL